MTDFGTPSTPMPMSGARTGPPWEQPGAFFQRWIDTAKSILLDPHGRVPNVRRTGGLGGPLTYYAVGIAPRSSSVSCSSSDWDRRMMGGGGRGAAMGGADDGRVSVFVALVMIVFRLLLHRDRHRSTSCCRCSAAPSHGYEATARTFAYAHGSAAPIGMVPFCGGPIAGIWALVCAMIRPRRDARDDRSQVGHRDLRAAASSAASSDVPGLGRDHGDDHGLGRVDVAVGPSASVTLTWRRLAPLEIDHEALWLLVGSASLCLLGVALATPGIQLPRCAFKTITGLPCPTCGLTRTIIALSRGDLSIARSS